MTIKSRNCNDTEKSRFVHIQLTGEVRGGPRAIFQQIGDSELCCGVQSLMDDETVRHAQELQRCCGQCCRQ